MRRFPASKCWSATSISISMNNSPMPARSTWSQLAAGVPVAWNQHRDTRRLPFRRASRGHGQSPPGRTESLFRGMRAILGSRLSADSRGRNRTRTSADITCSCSPSRSSSRMSSSRIEALSSRFRKLSRSMERSITPQAAKAELDLLNKESWTGMADAPADQRIDRLS